MRKTLLLAFLVLLLSSCATLLNTPIEPLTIAVSEPARIVLDGDTLPRLSTSHYRMVERSWDSLKISVVNNHCSKTIKIKPRNSAAYWMNLYPSSLWLGFLIDQHNPKRYSYPPLVYIDMNKQGNDYLTYFPLDPAYSKYNNVLKINPVKAVSPIYSGVEVSLEKRTGSSFSTQLTGAYLFRNPVWRPKDDIDHRIKGFQAGVEERYYLKRSAPLGPYLALDFSYLKTQFKEDWLFVDGESFVDSTLYYETYVDTFGIKKQTYSLNFKYGYQYVIKRFTLDMSIGMGIRYKDVVHIDRKNPEDLPESHNEPDFYQISNESGKRWTASFPFNIRIGWTF